MNVTVKADRKVRALQLFLKLNQQAMLYTPRSHFGLRAARLMPAIRAKYL